MNLTQFESILKDKKEKKLKDRKRVFEESLQVAKIAFEAQKGTSRYDKLSFEMNQQAQKNAFEDLQSKLQREFDHYFPQTTT